MQNLKPNEKRAKNAIFLIKIVMAFEIISLVSDYFQYNLLQNISDGITISEDAVYANDLRQRIISIVHFAAYIFSAIIFIQWFRRAYFNLHEKINHLEYSEAAAAYSWFIPIVSLYQPYKIMKELYIETDDFLSKKSTDYTNKISTAFLGWWWALWIINNLIGQNVFKSSFKASTIDQLIDNTELSMVSDFIGIPLALITIKIIHDYAKIEHLLFNQQSEELNNSDLENIIST